MIKLNAAQTIQGVRFGVGAVLNSDDATESQLLAAGVATALPLVLTYTWSTKPNYSLTAAGTIINISDVGGSGGSLWKATSSGWVPLNGSVLLASNWGTELSPVATISGSTAALFAPTGGAGSLVIPALMLIAGRSVLRVGCVIRRTGVNGTAVGRIYLGTAADATDASVYGLSYAATTLLDARPEVDVAAINATTVTSTNWLTPGSVGSSVAPTKTLTTKINLAADMTISFAIDSANALDSFDLIGYYMQLRSL